ncbi:MAG TPA: DUF1624 domain-containing protein [Anaerolineae bacterium]|nr:DUF1624 domain-containing protein [Anaerolineae bacterium]
MQLSGMSKSPSSDRLDFVDMLRGLGLLFMVVDHAYDWWLVEAENRGSWGRTTEFIGTLAAPLFLVVVGVSVALATDARRARGIPEGKATWFLVRRGLLVWLWGYLLNLMVFFDGDNWPDLFAFDVLQCIGLGMVLIAPLAVWGPTWSFPLLALALGWGGQFADRLVFPGYLGTMVNGIPPIAYFPLLPWLCFIPVGLLWGRAMARWREDRARSNQVAVGSAVVGLIALMGAALAPSDIGYRHPRLVSILFDLAVAFWMGTVLYFWCRWSWGRRALSWLRDMGRETLLLYLLHHLVGFRLFYLLGWVTGRSWRGQYGVFDIPQATLLLVVLCSVMWTAAWVWSRWKAQPGVWQRRARLWL